MDEPDVVWRMVEAMKAKGLHSEYEEAQAAARVLLEGLRQHDPCDIVIDGAGLVCARHDRSPGQCPIEQYARLIGVGLTTIKG